MEQTEALVNEHQGRIYREELLLNCGTSVSKTIHALPQGATNQQIKDAVLHNHSNLRTVSQCSNAYQQLHQKPDEALQTYNTRYTSYFNLTYPKLEIDNPLSRMPCIHCASSLYGKLSDEMTGRFNQDLPENLHTAFEKAANFEPCIITKVSTKGKSMISTTSCQDEFEINEAHIRNPNYKGKNYNPNYQQNKRNFSSNSSNPGNNYQSNGNQGNNYTKSNHQEKPVNVSVTLNGPVSKEQLYKIQEVLRHPSQYGDRLKSEDRPATGEYAKSFNKFHPKKIEVNEATVEEAIKFGQSLKRSKEDIAETIDIYKSLGNDTFYGPEEEPMSQLQEQQDQ